MTGREIVAAGLSHRENSEGIVPYTIAFESAELERKVNEYYGCPWNEKTIRFIDYPLYMDTTIEKEIGVKRVRDVYGTIWRTDKLPWHQETFALEEASFKGYTFPTLDDFIKDHEAAGSIEKANKRISENGGLYNIIPMGWGIFEQTWRIRGFENAMCDIAAEEDFYSELVERITELFAGMVEYCAEVKADAFLFGDDWGSQTGVIMGPEKWRKFFKPAWKKIYDKVHAQGKLVLSHSCGSVYDIIPDAIEIGLDALESVQPEARGMNPFKLKEEFGDKLTFWGTVGSQSVIPFYSPTEIRAHIKELKSVVGKNGGYIIAPAKPFQPETPVENAIAVIEAMAEL